MAAAWRFQLPHPLCSRAGSTTGQCNAVAKASPRLELPTDDAQNVALCPLAWAVVHSPAALLFAPQHECVVAFGQCFGRRVARLHEQLARRDTAAHLRAESTGHGGPTQPRRLGDCCSARCSGHYTEHYTQSKHRFRLLVCHRLARKETLTIACSAALACSSRPSLYASSSRSRLILSDGS